MWGNMKGIVLSIVVYAIVCAFGLFFVRTAVYGFFRVFGYEFWLQPDLLEGPAICPLVTYHKLYNEKGTQLGVRILCTFIFVWVCYLAIFAPETGEHYWKSSVGRVTNLQEWAKPESEGTKNKSGGNKRNYSMGYLQKNSPKKNYIHLSI